MTNRPYFRTSVFDILMVLLIGLNFGMWVGNVNAGAALIMLLLVIFGLKRGTNALLRVL